MPPPVNQALLDEQKSVVPEQEDDTPKAAEDVMAENYSAGSDRKDSVGEYGAGDKTADRFSSGIGTRGRGKALSVVGPSLIVKGELEAAEDLLIEGRLEGLVKHTAEHLIIGKEGVVHADIHARNLSIEGVVEGNIVGSESVMIHDTATVRGNIYTPRISISDGAHFIGSIDMDTASAQKH